MQIGLYDCQGPQPSIKYVHTSGEAKGDPHPLGLEEALPLAHLLTPVGSCKDCIAAAVDSLQADPDQHGSITGAHDVALGTRSFGGALQAVLRYRSSPASLRIAAQPSCPEGLQGARPHTSCAGRSCIASQYFCWHSRTLYDHVA